MKKIFSLLLVLVVFTGFTSAQVKVQFSLTNRTITAGILKYDVVATVPPGQTWKVGSCNIRVVAFPNPTGSLTAHADNPAVNANPNISNANGYQAMTTTAVNTTSGIGIGLNILTFNTSGFYNFGPGTYTLGQIRYNVTTPNYADTMKFRNPPLAPTTVIYDSTKKCAYGGTASDSSRYTTTDPIVLEVSMLNVIPTEYNLFQNYPNPFNPVTNIKYDVPKNSFVKIRIYDIAGKEVRTLVDQEMEAGSYETQFDASKLASGIYFYKMETKDYNKVMKMVLLK